MTEHDELGMFLKSEQLRRNLVDITGGSLSFPIEDLIRLSCNNVTVRALFDAWRHGRFASLEQALVAMVVHLAAENERLMRTQRLPMEFCMPVDEQPSAC